MIKDKEVAAQMNDLMIGITTKVVDSMLSVIEKCGPDEGAAYRKAAARAMGSIYSDVLFPLWDEHPELRPKHMPQDAKTGPSTLRETDTATSTDGPDLTEDEAASSSPVSSAHRKIDKNDVLTNNFIVEYDEDRRHLCVYTVHAGVRDDNSVHLRMDALLEKGKDHAAQWLGECIFLFVPALRRELYGLDLDDQ
jgi:hypothetical protein